MKLELVLAVLGLVIATPGLATAITLTTHPKVKESRKLRIVVALGLAGCLTAYVICLGALGSVENHLK